MGRRPRRHGGAVLRRLKNAALLDRQGRWRRLRAGVDRGRCWVAMLGQLLSRQFGRQAVPAELLVERIGAHPRHLPPVVDRAGGARRHTGHAQIALVGIDHIVARVMGDRTDGASGLAGVATDADLGVDQMLPDQGGLSGGVHLGLRRFQLVCLFWRLSQRRPRRDAAWVHRLSRFLHPDRREGAAPTGTRPVKTNPAALAGSGAQLKRTYSKLAGWRLMPTTGGAIQLAN